jgi:hypothetical protein
MMRLLLALLLVAATATIARADCIGYAGPGGPCYPGPGGGLYPGPGGGAYPGPGGGAYVGPGGPCYPVSGRPREQTGWTPHPPGATIPSCRQRRAR